jgi:hypothetical protein
MPHACPACGYGLDFEPWSGDSPSDEVCPSCGIQFGYHDSAEAGPDGRAAIYKQWRAKWEAAGRPSRLRQRREVVSFGPCCFCGQPIDRLGADPCRVSVTTAAELWQVWYCHAACFRSRLANLPGAPGHFDPAHF